MIGGVFIARKYKQVKEKKITYDLEEWAEVERRAAIACMKTGTYIKRISVAGEMNCYDVKAVVPLMSAMRSCANNINQIARKANEINSIYAEDIEKLREENTQVCRYLNTFLFTIQSTKV